MLQTQNKPNLVVERRPESLLSLSFLRTRIAPDLQEAFVEDTRICLDCGSKVTLKEDELCCTSCGRVWSSGFSMVDDQIPIEETDVSKGHAEGSYNPTSALVFGHNLGSVVDGRALYRIIAKAPQGETDKPLRAQQIKLITARSDHPTTMNLLSYGSLLCANYVGHSNRTSDAVFADSLGHLLRKLAAYYVIRGENQTELKRVASACFYSLYVQRSPSDANRAFKELGLTPELVSYVETLLNVLQCPKRPKKLRPKKQTKA